MSLLNLIHFDNCIQSFNTFKNLTNITNSSDNNFSNIFEPYKNILIQYYNYNFIYFYPGKDVDINYILYMLYSSFIWSIILSSFILLNTQYSSIVKYKYILIDISNIFGSIIGFMIYSSYSYIILNIISGIILNLLYMILLKNKILRIYIVNYILYTSFATSVMLVGSLITYNHILHVIDNM